MCNCRGLRKAGTPVLRNLGQLHLLGVQEFAFADSCTCLSALGSRTMGSGLLRELLLQKKIGIGEVYVTDPVVATFAGP